MTSTQLPCSTITLFTSYSLILRVITKASSCGWIVSILSSSEKLNEGQISNLAFFGSELRSPASDLATDITLASWEPILPGAANITLIVPNRGLEEAFPWAPDLDWSPCPLGQYRNCCNFPSLTSCSRWFHNIRQSSVVYPRSWWYWKWRLWLRLKGSPLILFGHLKYGSFLIFSKTWCTGSRNTVFTTCGAASPDYPAKSRRGLLLL